MKALANGGQVTCYERPPLANFSISVKITENNRKINFLVEFSKLLPQLITGVCLLSNVETRDLS